MNNLSLVKLGSVSEKIDYGLTTSAKEIEGKPKFLRITDIQDNNVDWDSVPSCDCSEKNYQKYSLKKGDIVFARTGATTGKSFLIRECPEKSVFASYLIRVRPSSDLIPEYLAYFFQTPNYWRQISLNSTGTAQTGVNSTKLKELEIPLLPVTEQKRIAAILDKADAIRRKRQEAIKLTEEFARSLFLDMFGDPITNPKGWKKDLLGNYIAHSNNGLSRRRKIIQNEGKIVLRLQDIKAGYIEFSNPNRIPLDKSEEKRFQVFKDDLLFIRVNGNKKYVGRCAVYQGFNEDVYHNDHIIRIQLKPNLDASFLSFIFNDDFGKKMITSKIKTSAGQYTISQQGIESIQMPIPPIKIQQRFKELASKIINQQSTYHKSLKESENLFHSLLQRAFKGEL